MRLKYRAEIDGLRAISLISVILFHANTGYFTGGFVGVDIFFVISGYLITTIIMLEKEEGTFSLVDFYERRARRILPPLLLMVLVSYLIAIFFFLTVDLKNLAKSIIAVNTFSANVFFARFSYWGTDVQPMLHTWSLAIEEQYYFLFPLLLMAFWRWRLPNHYILFILVIIAILSLIAAQFGVYGDPQSNFYSSFSRAWEIAIGSIAAFWLRLDGIGYCNPTTSKYLREGMGVVGLIMISGAIFVFDKNTPFPSMYTLIPTIGAMLIVLFASPSTLVGRVLSANLLVKIGIVSYSTYLWHQPLLVFVDYLGLSKNYLFLLLAIVCSFLLGIVSWQYVEKPFRDKSKFNRKTIFAFAVAGILISLTLASIGYLSDGFSYLLVERHELAKRISPNCGLNPDCTDCNEEYPQFPNCRTDYDPEILVWGDSFAMHLVPGILASNPKVKFIQMTKSSCGPFFDIAAFGNKIGRSLGWAKECLDFTAKVKAWLQANRTVKYAVLSSTFHGYFPSPGTNLLLRNGTITNGNFDLVVNNFEQTLNELNNLGISPVVFSPPPANDVNLGRCVVLANLHNADGSNCNFHPSELTSVRLAAYEFLEKFEKRHRVVRLDKLLCDKTRCLTHVGPILIYRDKGHLAREGGVVLGKLYNFYDMITAASMAKENSVREYPVGPVINEN